MIQTTVPKYDHRRKQLGFGTVLLTGPKNI